MASTTRPIAIHNTLIIDYRELVSNARFLSQDESIYTVGIQCCDRCYCDVNTVTYNKGMWACEYFAKLTSANDNIPINITLNFDICMDCYETIIGPMTHNTYKHNPNIDNIAHDIVVKGVTNYYTCRVLPMGTMLCVYVIDQYSVSDKELKESIDMLQETLNATL